MLSSCLKLSSLLYMFAVGWNLNMTYKRGLLNKTFGLLAVAGFLFEVTGY